MYFGIHIGEVWCNNVWGGGGLGLTMKSLKIISLAVSVCCGGFSSNIYSSHCMLTAASDHKIVKYCLQVELLAMYYCCRVCVSYCRHCQIKVSR